MLTGAQQSTGNMRSGESHGLTARCREGFDSTVEDYPLTTAVGAFAVGLMFGVAAGAVLAAPLHLERRRTAESLGRRVLDALQDYVPDSMHHYLRA
jgi:hypothetical protein